MLVGGFWVLLEPDFVVLARSGVLLSTLPAVQGGILVVGEAFGVFSSGLLVVSAGLLRP